MIRQEAVRIPIPAPMAADNPLLITAVTQEQGNWCWAACAKMVDTFFGGNQTQCQIATTALGVQGGCCKTPLPGGCNVTRTDPQITALWGTLGVGNTYAAAAAAWADVLVSITAQKPVECGLSWRGGGGHVILVAGAKVGSSGNQVYVIDPDGAHVGWFDYTYVTTAYGLGVWDATWTTLSRAEHATMAKTYQLDPARRTALAASIGSRLGQLPDPALRQHASMALESALERWMLPLDRLQAGAARLGNVALDLGSLHLQLLGDGAPVAYAHANKPGTDEGPLQVFGIANGPMAGQVAAGLDWLAQHAHRDGTINLLAIPAHHVTVLWVAGTDGDDCLVIQAPPGTGLPTDRLLSGQELLKALAALPPKGAGRG